MSDLNLLFSRKASLNALEQFKTKEELADLFSELTQELFEKCKKIGEIDGLNKKLQAENEKLTGYLNRSNLLIACYCFPGEICSGCRFLKELKEGKNE